MEKNPSRVVLETVVCCLKQKERACRRWGRVGDKDDCEDYYADCDETIEDMNEYE